MFQLGVEGISGIYRARSRIYDSFQIIRKYIVERCSHVSNYSSIEFDLWDGSTFGRAIIQVHLSEVKEEVGHNDRSQPEEMILSVVINIVLK